MVTQRKGSGLIKKGERSYKGSGLTKTGEWSYKGRGVVS